MLGIVDFQIDRRNGCSMGIGRRVPECFSNPGLQFFRDRVLHALGLVMNLIPRDAEGLVEIELKQPVMANYFKRDPASGIRKVSTTVGLVISPELVNRLEVVFYGLRHYMLMVYPVEYRQRISAGAVNG